PLEALDAIARVLQHAHPPVAKILAVDDDPHLLDLLRSLLEPWGFQTILLEDPRQFWETLERSQPNLLLLDLKMPHLSGIELCRVVRNDPRWQDLPILMLSAHRNSEIVQQVFVAGADDYIQKPIVEPELVARILNRLERSRKSGNNN
ncbi:MAG: response regulator, partial [Cyanobacteriota bacterium]|nr:response regulator [Cyanobacteriota bacterium]